MGATRPHQRSIVRPATGQQTRWPSSTTRLVSLHILREPRALCAVSATRIVTDVEIALSQVTNVQEGIARFSSNVSRIAELHSRTLNTADDNASRQNAALLDELVGETRKLSNELKEKIQALASYPASRPQDQTIRKNQVRHTSRSSRSCWPSQLMCCERRRLCLGISLWRCCRTTSRWRGITVRGTGSG